MIRYMTNTTYYSIIELEVDSETKHSVTMDGDVLDKINVHSRIFDTRKEARTFLRAEATVEIDRLLNRTSRVVSALAQLGEDE